MPDSSRVKGPTGSSRRSPLGHATAAAVTINVWMCQRLAHGRPSVTCPVGWATELDGRFHSDHGAADLHARSKWGGGNAMRTNR